MNGWDRFLLVLVLAFVTYVLVFAFATGRWR